MDIFQLIGIGFVIMVLFFLLPIKNNNELN